MPTGYTPGEIAAVAKTHIRTIEAKIDGMITLSSGGYEDETAYYRAFLIAASERLATLFADLPAPPP